MLLFYMAKMSYNDFMVTRQAWVPGLILVLTSTVLAEPNSNEGSLRMACQPAIKTQQSLVGKIGNFKPLKDPSGPNALTRISLFDGHPSELADLKPDNGDENAPPYWTLMFQSPRTYWMVCHYSDTSIRLARPLPKGLALCQVEVDHNQEPIGLLCRR